MLAWSSPQDIQLNNGINDSNRDEIVEGYPLNLDSRFSINIKSNEINIGSALEDYGINKNEIFDDFIYDQNNDHKVKRIKMGFGFGHRNGCSWIAIYNAMKLLGTPVQPADIVYYIENHDPWEALTRGLFGCTDLAIYNYFKDKGYKVEYAKTYKRIQNYRFPNKNEYDEKIKNADVAIVVYLFILGGHYITVKWSGISFNIYNSGTGNLISRDSLYDYLTNEEKGFGINTILVNT
jgi:hypothetical protein